jgi:hypothetical protein
MGADIKTKLYPVYDFWRDVAPVAAYALPGITCKA